VDSRRPPSGQLSDYLSLPAKGQRVVDGVKILLDVAKESSDWFPPLKSALGGISALVKHYEVHPMEGITVSEFVPSSPILVDSVINPGSFRGYFPGVSFT